MSSIVRGKITRGDLAVWDGKTATSSRIDASSGTVTGLAVNDYVDVLQVFGAGTNRTRGTIADALQTIGSSNVTIKFAPGTWDIDDDLTIPSNITSYIPAGVIFDVTAGKTLTFNGPVMRESLTWTSGSGTVTANDHFDLNFNQYYEQTQAEIDAGVTPTDYSYAPGVVERYGAVGDGSTDDSTAIQAALDSSKNVILSDGKTYAIATGLTFGLLGQSFKSETTVSPSTGNLKWTGSSGGGPMLKVGNGKHNPYIQGIYFDANMLANICLHVEVTAGSQTKKPVLNDLWFIGYRTRGMVLGEDDIVDVKNGQFQIVNGRNWKFSGGALDTAIALVVNAQNAEFIDISGLYFDPFTSVGGGTYQNHDYHIYLRSGSLNIRSLVTTRSDTMAIKTHGPIKIKGWNAEDAYLIEWASGAMQGQSSLRDIAQRGTESFELPDDPTDPVIKWAGGTASLTVCGARLKGSFSIGSTSAREVVALGVKFDAVGAGFIFYGPMKQTGIYHDIETGHFNLRGTAPEILVEDEAGVDYAKIGKTVSFPTIVTFADGDATPTVTEGTTCRTVNTAPTTITDFDDGTIGQIIFVKFDDANTTIDFTGTNLNGNAGVDWSPAQDDFMMCTYMYRNTGNEWYCIIGDTTA